MDTEMAGCHHQGRDIESDQTQVRHWPRPESRGEYTMKAFLLTDIGDADTTILPAAAPERALSELLGGAIDVSPLSKLAAHLDMWTLYEPLAVHHDPRINDLATAIASYRHDTQVRIYGPAVITAHTDSGLVTSLSARDVTALNLITGEIRANWSPTCRQAG